MITVFPLSTQSSPPTVAELSIDKTKTALVVIDLQKGIASMPTAPHSASTVIENARRIAEAFRKNGIPVFLVHVVSMQKDALRPIADEGWSMRGERR